MFTTDTAVCRISQHFQSVCFLCSPFVCHDGMHANERRPCIAKSICSASGPPGNDIFCGRLFSPLATLFEAQVRHEGTPSYLLVRAANTYVLVAHFILHDDRLLATYWTTSKEHVRSSTSKNNTEMAFLYLLRGHFVVYDYR